MAGDSLAVLIESSDLDGLVRRIDALVDAKDWNGLVEARDRCREAVQRGKQVWGAAHFADYRIALDAPGELATTVVQPGAGRFALGPLWEVAASTHDWEELEGVTDPALRTLIAHERTLRGDQVPDEGLLRDVVDAPLGLAEWELVYPGAVYRPDKVDFPEVEMPVPQWVDLPEPGVAVEDPLVVEALRDLTQPWLDESNGRSEARAVQGTALEAIRALGPRRARVAELDLSRALAVMVWTGASGGAYGRRRGNPVGRALAWWALACLLGLEDSWPVDPAFLGEQAAGLRWLLWDPGDQAGGWHFHLAAEDPMDGLSWAVSAVDAR